MSCVLIQDDRLCEAYLKNVCPQWISEMKTEGEKELVPGTTTIVFQSAWNPAKQEGVFVCYFGHGAQPDDKGWCLQIFQAKTVDEFEATAKRLGDAIKVNSGGGHYSN